MSFEGQVPRVSIIWLLLAQVAVILPHLHRMPWWIFVIWLLCALWRLAMFRGEASYPGRFLRVVLVLFGAAGIFISQGGLGGLDVAVALLLLSFSLKIVEVKNRRDLNLVFYLALLVIATAFLFSQSIYLAAYQVLCILFVLTAMVATQYSTRNRSPMQALRVTSRLMAQAVPIMLVFFLVFPRLEPLWKVPGSRAAADTGMSDSMAPGDIARLNQSDRLAFRARFSGSLPPGEMLYWRGMTFLHFDGRNWTRQESAGQWYREKTIYLRGEPLDYTLTMEPTRQHWLYTLPLAAQRQPNSSDQLLRLPDFVVASLTPIHSRRQFQFSAYPETPLGLEESTETLADAVELPEGFNPRSIALAKKLSAEYAEPDAFVEGLRELISAGSYYYTLEPPRLGRHSIDEFLFETRRGFCEHYASAAVFLLRAAGHPARVVAGYQGGEYNSLNDTLTVRQFDAHAWAEYWQAGRGWVRIDPTAFVAPSRILMGMQGALASDSSIESSLFSALYLRNLPLVREARIRLEALNLGWQEWFVNFDNRRQGHLLEKLLGEVTPMRTAMLVLTVLAFSFVVVALFQFLRYRSSPQSPERRYYSAFLDKLAKLGLQRGRSEAPGDFGRRAAQDLPLLRNDILAINGQYESIAYAGRNAPEDVARLRRLVAGFRPK